VKEPVPEKKNIHLFTSCLCGHYTIRDWNPGFEKPRPRGNPAIFPKKGLRATETRVSGFVFRLRSVHVNSRLCNSLMRFSLVIVHKLSQCLFLLFLRTSRQIRVVFMGFRSAITDLSK